MTAIASIRIPGKGIVIAADGRVTGSDASIVSDDCRKITDIGRFVVAAAGYDGPLMHWLRKLRPATWTDLIGVVEEAQNESQPWDALVVDKQTHKLLEVDSGLYAAAYTHRRALGSGSDIVTGFLDASPTPKTLAEAERLAKAAVRAACRRNALCGGKIRSVVVAF